MRPGSLLFRLIAAGLQPEDVSERFHNQTPPAATVAEIAAVGDGVRGWSPPERVLIGRRLPIGDTVPGLAEFISIDARFKQSVTLKLPVDIPSDEATLVPSVALAARILREARVPRNGSLLVVGLGLVGQAVLLLARHQGIQNLFAADASPTLQKKGEYNGASRIIRVAEESVRDVLAADTGGRGVNAAIFLSPEPGWVQEGMVSLAPGGTVVLGIPFSASIRMALNTAHIQSHEMRIQGVREFGPRDVKTALNAITQGNVNGESLISRRIPWAELDGQKLEPGYWEHATHVVVEGPATGTP